MKTKSLLAGSIYFLLCVLLTGTAGATRYSLTLAAQGDGTVTPDNTNNPYPSGATITVTATPATGWYFDHWSGNATGNTNPLQVIMNSDLVITGNFLAYPTYTVTLATNGLGGIALNPTSGSYFSNELVTATATPAAGWIFAGWSGALSGTNNPATFAADTNEILTGTFGQLPALTVEPVSVTNPVGSSVSFSAQATGSAPLNYQWYFSGGPLANATGTVLSLTDASSSQAGNYWVVVANNYGSITSSVATLTLTNVLGPTNIVNSLNQGSLLAAIVRGGWVGIGFNGTLTLTNTISITNHVILDGSGVAATISGGNAVQLFYVTEGANLTISNLTLANGSATNTLTDGGAIYNAGGNVWLVGCTLTNNLAQSSAVNGLSRGGALFNNGGVASLYQCVITGNSAIGGGVELLQGLGGAIYNTNGSVAIIGCELNGNSASDLVGAEISFDEGGWGQALGGAVFQASGIMAITNSSFVSNQAVGPDGGRQSDAFSAYGGALAAAGGTLFVDDSQFMTNQAVGGSDTYGWGATAGGGAVYCAGNATIAECTFGGNQTIGGSGEAATSVAGGGIYNDTAGVLALNRCAIYANVAEGGFATINIIPLEIAAGFGGGVFNAGQFAATNCTVAFNSAIGGENLTTPLGTTGNALGGGLYNNSGAAIVAMNLTIADNVCLSPAGQANGFYFTNGLAAGAQIANTNGTFHLHNSILAYGTNSNAYGPITDDGYNICSDGSAGLDSGSSFNNTDPLLAPLGSYGGPTWCMALLPNSPAIGGADPSDFPATDQRGYPRPAGSGPDIGAYEYGASPGAPMLTLGTSGNSVVVSFTAFPANLYRLQWSTNLVAWNDLSTNGPVYGPTMINQSVSKQVHSQCFFRLIMQ